MLIQYKAQWDTDKFLKIVLAIQLAMLGIFSLEFLGLKVLFLRSLIGFIYLTFIPGAIITRMLRLRNLDNIETLLYTIGLSISSIIFVGLMINFFLPLIKLNKPIGAMNFLIIFSILVLLSCIFIYKHETNPCNEWSIVTRINLSSYDLFFILFPFLSIIGAYLVNYYHTNILLMFLIFLISLTPIYSIWKDNSKIHYAYQIFIVTLSLLYQSSLISSYLFGNDLCLEYYVSNLVIINQIWDPSTSNPLNGMLSLVILAPIYSLILNIELTWVYKLIYPLFFSLVAVGLFKIYNRYTNNLIAYISCFFFISLFTVYTEMLSLARQEIAEFFLVLLLLLIFNESIDKIKRALLMIVFGASIIISHYSISYIYIFCFIFVYLIQEMIICSNFKSFFKSKNIKMFYNFLNRVLEDRRLINLNFILLFIVCSFTWYVNVSDLSLLNSLAHVGNQIATSFFNEFMDVKSSDGLEIIFKGMNSFSKIILRDLLLISQCLISFGLLFTISYYSKHKFNSTYLLFSLASLSICIFALFVPYFGKALNSTRLYHISLFFLSPFFVIGWIFAFQVLRNLIRKDWAKISCGTCSQILAIFLSVYFLFNIGFVAELFNDGPSSISLSQSSIINNDSLVDRALYSSIIHTYEQDVFGSRWLSNHSASNSIYYSDFIAQYSLLSYGMINRTQIHDIVDITRGIRSNSFIRLGYANIVYNASLYRTSSRQSIPFSTSDLDRNLFSRNKIYANGANILFYT